ncbi:MAG: ribosome recycling factor [Calditrichaeota bacterium]|nr:MAG: ribosome recycling factor [Calditrichota bacterium]
MNQQEIYSDANTRMDKTLDALHHELAKVRTGRATPALLDTVRIEYYGQVVPLNQAATVSAPEPRLLTVQPWEKNLLPEIEKAIQKADLGLNPANDGQIIRIPIPQLSEERRKDLVKLVKKFGEDAKIAVRNVRRDANDHLKKLHKGNEISEDELSVELDRIQKLTDDHIQKIDTVLEAKEKEVLEI